MTPPLAREAIFPRIDGIRKNAERLATLATLSETEFFQEDAFALAQHHLRLALEGIFHIGSHILSRLPGGRAVEYKEIARKLGELKVVPHDFAQKTLVPMAGMRNMLVHNYADMDPKQFRKTVIAHHHDIETYLQYIKEFLQHLDQFHLTME